MPIMAKSNDEYTEVKAIKTPDGTEIDYVLSKVDNTYKRTYTATRELEDTPPLEFKSIKPNANLTDYRICGQSSRNLFDFGEWSKNINANGDNSLVKGIDGITITANSNDVFTTPYAYVHEGVYKIYVKPNTNYLLSWVSNNNLSGRVFIFKNGISDGTHAVNTNNNTTKYLLFGTDADTEFITLRFGVTTAGNAITYSKIMLNAGATPLPYEPYGESVGDLVTSGEHAGEYKVPVTVEGKNLFDEKYDAISPDNITYKAIYIGNNICTLSTDMPLNNALGANLFLLTGNVSTGAATPTNGVYVNHSKTVASTNGYVTIAYRSYDITPIDYHTQLEKGSTATPYEPYHTPVTTPIYLPEQIKKVGDEAEYIDYANQKQHRVRKNLLPNTATSQTINGITFTVNADGSVTCNGTSTTQAYIRLTSDSSGIPFNAGRYIVSQSCDSTLFGYIDWTVNGVNQARTKNDELELTLNENSNISAWVNITPNKTCDNLTFYPMIHLATVEDDTYEPYIENTDLDVNLPALPTVTGTNVLSVGTEVQPSDMYIKGNFKMIAGGGE